MQEVLTLLQLGSMLVSAPLLILVAVALLLRRPLASTRVTGALIVLTLAFSMVSLRDWYLVQDDRYAFSYIGLIVRVVKMIAVLYALYVLVTERDDTERRLNQDERDVLQNETGIRQNLRDVSQDAREVRQRERA
jgi:glycerol-3-phosphate acyltransferase PlsY